MPYVNCKGCNKRIYQSPYESKYFYSYFCNDCNVQQIQDAIDNEKCERDDTITIQTQCKYHKIKDENCKECKRNENLKFNLSRKRLMRTDNDEDYLDSTYCEYTKTDYETMIQRRLVLKNRAQQLKIDLARTNDEIKELDIKIAIAKKEQFLRKKLRRETRELLPALQEVKNNADKVRENILDSLDITNLINENDNNDKNN